MHTDTEIYKNLLTQKHEIKITYNEMPLNGGIKQTNDWTRHMKKKWTQAIYWTTTKRIENVTFNRKLFSADKRNRFIFHIKVFSWIGNFFFHSIRMFILTELTHVFRFCKIKFLDAHSLSIHSHWLVIFIFITHFFSLDHLLETTKILTHSIYLLLKNVADLFSLDVYSKKRNAANEKQKFLFTNKTLNVIETWTNNKTYKQYDRPSSKLIIHKCNTLKFVELTTPNRNLKTQKLIHFALKNHLSFRGITHNITFSHIYKFFRTKTSPCLFCQFE